MDAKDEIRNVSYELTTGDYIDFEVLHNGVWRRAHLAKSAVSSRPLNNGSQTERQAFEANIERIAAAARNHADSTPIGEKIKLASYVF